MIAVSLRRSTDELFRYGGEEFPVLLPEIEKEGVLRLAENMRCVVERMAFHIGGADVKVTVSIGAACMQPSVENTESRTLVAVADKALYQAKRNGRNQVAE